MNDCAEKRREAELLSSRAKDYLRFKEAIATEYQKQRLLAEIHPDRGEILHRLNPPPAQLAHVSEDKFWQITRTMQPIHAQMLTNRRRAAAERTKTNVKYREEVRMR